MAEIGTAYVSLLPSAKGFGTAVERELGSAGTRAGTTASKGFVGTFQKGVGRLAYSLGALFAVNKVGDLFSSAVAEARESQKVGAITAQVIKTTGGAAKVTADQVGQLAEQISNKTGIDDEAIQSASNLLLTFKNLRDETGQGNDAFSQATQLAADMGAALGKEPRAAAISLGKALNDPVKGISALTRVGVSFTDQQKKNIENLVSQGDTLGAQKVILKELRSEFGGTAEASATAGEKAKTSWNNLKEQLGTLLLPLLDKLQGFLSDKVIPKVAEFIDGFQQGKGAGGDFKDALLDVWDASKKLWSILQPIGTWLLDNPAVIYGLVAALAAWKLAVILHNVVQAIQLAMLMIVTPGTFLYAVASGIAATATAIWAAAVWLLTTPLGLLVLAIIAVIVVIILVIKYHKQIGAFIAKTWNQIKAAVSKAVAATVAWIKARWNDVIGWLRGVGGKITAGLSNMWEGAKNKTEEFKAFIGRKVGEIVRFILGIPDKIRALGGRLLSVGKDVGGKLISGFFDGLDAAGGFVSDLASSVKGAINSALNLPVTIHGPGPLPDFTIPAFAEGGRVKGSMFLAGERGWESIIPDKMMVEALTAAATAGNNLPVASPRTTDRLRLVVDGYEFNAYVDDRADVRVSTASALDAERGRTSWR